MQTTFTEQMQAIAECIAQLDKIMSEQTTNEKLGLTTSEGAYQLVERRRRLNDAYSTIAAMKMIQSPQKAN